MRWVEVSWEKVTARGESGGPLLARSCARTGGVVRAHQNVSCAREPISCAHESSRAKRTSAWLERMRRLPSAGARARARAPRVARADVLAAALDGAITRSGVQAAPARRPSLVLQSLRLSSLVGHGGRERACARFYSAKGLLIARRPSSRLPPQLPSHLDSRILTVAYLWLR